MFRKLSSLVMVGFLLLSASGAQAMYAKGTVCNSIGSTRALVALFDLASGYVEYPFVLKAYNHYDPGACGQMTIMAGSAVQIDYYTRKDGVRLPILEVSAGGRLYYSWQIPKPISV